MSKPPEDGGSAFRVPLGDPRLWWAVVAVALVVVVILLLTRGGEAGEPVPSVVGLGEEAASGAVVSREYATRIERRQSPEPDGTVIDQEPEAGSELDAGSVVTLTVSGDEDADDLAEQPSGPVEVPDLVGRQHVLAGAALERQGLVPETRMVERGQRCCVVVAQRPRPGTTLEAGETVRLDVALAVGADRLEVRVPDLEGVAAAAARARARELGFTMRTTERDAPSPDLVGKVVEQRPRPGSSALELSRITLVVAR